MATYESWDYDEQQQAPRWLYLAGGSALLWLGLRRWSIPAAIVTSAGALLLSRGLHSEEGASIGAPSADRSFERAGEAMHVGDSGATYPAASARAATAPAAPGRTARDRGASESAAPDRAPGNTVRDAAIYERGVDESSDESFPASDPPSWTPVTGSGGSHHDPGGQPQ